MTSQASNSPFARALDWLQADFKILPVGVAQAGAWKYAFIYDLVHRHYPNLPEEAHAIRQAEARRKLAELYLRSVGTAQVRDLTRLFAWTPADTERALGALVQAGLVVTAVRVTGQPGEWFALRELL
jgi:uncharacterized protein YcaQ